MAFLSSSNAAGASGSLDLSGWQQSDSLRKLFATCSSLTSHTGSPARSAYGLGSCSRSKWLAARRIAAIFLDALLDVCPPP